MKLLFKKDFSKQGQVIHKIGDVKEIKEENGTASYFLSRGIATVVEVKAEPKKEVKYSSKKEYKKVVEKVEEKAEVPEALEL